MRLGIGCTAMGALVAAALVAAPGAAPVTEPGHDHAFYRRPPVLERPSAASRSGPRRPQQAVAHYAGGKRARAEEAPAAHLIRLDHGAWEPTLGVTDNGTIFVTAFEDVVAPGIMRSTDGGKTWEDASPGVGPAHTHPATLDPYVYVDDIGGGRSRIFSADLYIGCSEISYSDDDGETWISNPVACGTPINDHQTIFAGPPRTSELNELFDYPHVLYYCWNGDGIYCSKSLDGGLTFRETESRALPPTSCDDAQGHGFAAPDGVVYVPRASCVPELAVSKDEGATWQVRQVAQAGTSGYHEAAVVADGKGNVFYLWMADDRQPTLVISRDHGKTWSRPLKVGHPDVIETNLPSITMGGSGKIALAYMGSTNSPGPPWTFSGCLPGCAAIPDSYDEVTWNGYVTVSANALARRPLFYSAPVNDPSTPLVRGTCGPGRCTNVGDFIDVEIAPDGTPWAVFVDAAGSDVQAVLGHLTGGPPLD